MNKVFALLALILLLVFALPMLQTCNVPAMQAQAMIEQAKANQETAKAAQAAAGAANTSSFFFGLVVALVVVTLCGLLAYLVYTRVRHQQQLEQTNQFNQPRPYLPRVTQTPSLVPGDPIQQLIQLQTLQMLQGMNQRSIPGGMPSQLPSPRRSAEIEEEW